MRTVPTPRSWTLRNMPSDSRPTSSTGTGLCCPTQPWLTTSRGFTSMTVLRPPRRVSEQIFTVWARGWEEPFPLVPIPQEQGWGLRGCPQLARHGAVACNASSQEAEGRSWAPGHPGLYSKYKVSLSYAGRCRETMEGGWKLRKGREGLGLPERRSTKVSPTFELKGTFSNLIFLFY